MDERKIRTTLTNYTRSQAVKPIPPPWVFPLAYVLQAKRFRIRTWTLEPCLSCDTPSTHLFPPWNGLTGGNMALVGKTNSPLWAGGLAAMTSRANDNQHTHPRSCSTTDVQPDSHRFPSIPPAEGVIIDTGLGEGLCNAGEGGATACWLANVGGEKTVSAGAGLKLGAGGGMLARLVGGSGGAKARACNAGKKRMVRLKGTTQSVDAPDSRQQDFDRWAKEEEHRLRPLHTHLHQAWVPAMLAEEAGPARSNMARLQVRSESAFDDRTKLT